MTEVHGIEVTCEVCERLAKGFKREGRGICYRCFNMIQAIVQATGKLMTELQEAVEKGSILD